MPNFTQSKKKADQFKKPEEIQEPEGEITEMTMEALATKARQREKFVKSGYFVWALFLHIALFLLLWTLIIFRAPPKEKETRFMPVAIKQPPPPPVPPPPPGGDAANAEPNVTVTPPPMTPSITAVSTPSTFNVATVKIPVPNMNITLNTVESGVRAGHGSGRGGHGFGSVGEVSGLLVGYLYDLKQTPGRQSTNMDGAKYHGIIKQFIASGWSKSILDQYYKSPKPLSTSYIFIPTLNAEDGPTAFGVQAEVKPNQYIIWYKATVAPTKDGTYHFVGVADDILAIRVDGKTVLDGDGGAVGPVWEGQAHLQHYHMPDGDFQPTCGPDNDFAVSDPIEARAGQKLNVEIIMGEQPGGRSNYFIYMQRDEDLGTYQKLSNGTPVLPVFQLDTDPVKPEGEARSFPPFSATPAPWQGIGDNSN